MMLFLDCAYCLPVTSDVVFGSVKISTGPSEVLPAFGCCLPLDVLLPQTPLYNPVALWLILVSLRLSCLEITSRPLLFQLLHYGLHFLLSSFISMVGSYWVLASV